ncbi:MAG TPA: cation:dicarboxylase symporter family transporter [Thermoanaerobaculia bacterium]|jgi:proton glutamate symport protein|nr:cation:dicarboxylase symporter family transporter [Thermoanaerobaculia bacterium]
MALPKVSLTTKIFIGLIAGILLGWLKPEWGTAMRPLSILFLNLIKSIIAPLIFATLVIGIAGTGDIRQVGRIGVKALVYFEIVTTFALFIGLGAVNLTRPGEGVSLAGVAHQEDKATLADRAKKLAADASTAAAKRDANTAAAKAAAAADAVSKGLTAPEPPAKPEKFGDIVAHLSPASIMKAMADGDVLQIVIFSVLFALAVTSIGERARPIINWCESLADIMFRFTEFVMKMAPIGVGAAMANTVGHGGLRVLRNLGMLVGTLYGSLVVFLVCVLLPVAFLFRVPLRDFFNAVKEPATIAFATTSSESALPKAMENMERLGVPRRIVGFVLPTGYSFNLDGTTLYLALASVFVAQAAGVNLSWTQQIVMMLTLMLTSKGVAGVPRASLVILLGTMASFHLPAEGVIVILGVDELMDMARTCVNVIGNCLATVVVARWENAFRGPEWVNEEAELEQVTGQPAIAG